MQKKTILVKAVSWKNRRIKIVNLWHPVYEDVDLHLFEVGKEHEIELEKNLNNEWVVMRILKSPERTVVKNELP